ncbi:MAG: surface lipoprotein assembly modifier [Gemmobacter sp.]
MLGTLLRTVGLVLALGAPAQAALTPIDHLMADNYPAARAALAAEVGHRPDAALHFAFLEGLVLVRQGQHEKAADLFRQILDVAPGFEPARRELTVLLARTGNTTSALYHAESLLATTQDPALRAELQGYIATQSRGKPRGVTTRFAIVPSSNANGGATTDTVIIAGLPFTLDPESRATSAIGVTLGATAWNRWQLSERTDGTLSGSIDILRYNHPSVSDETTAALRFDLGITRNRGRLQFGPVADMTWKNDRPYRKRLGITVSGQYLLRPDLQVGGGLTLWRQRHPDLDFLDGSLVKGELTASYIARPDLRLAVSLPFEVEKTNRSHLDHRDLGLAVSLEKSWSGGLSTGFSLGQSRNRYNGIYPGFAVPRRDRVTTVGLTLRHNDIRLGSFVPELSLRLTRSRSNIPFHDYSRRDVGLSLTQRF